MNVISQYRNCRVIGHSSFQTDLDQHECYFPLSSCAATLLKISFKWCIYIQLSYHCRVIFVCSYPRLIHNYCGEWEGGPCKTGKPHQLGDCNYSNWPSLVSPQSLCNWTFWWRVCVVTLPLWHFRWYRGFCCRTDSDRFYFFSYNSSDWFAYVSNIQSWWLWQVHNLSWVFASTLLWWSIFGPGLNDPGMLFCAVCICLFVVNFNLHYKFLSHSEIEFPYFLCMLCWWYHLGYTNIDYLVNLTETSWWNSFLDFFGAEFHQKSIKRFWRNIEKVEKKLKKV